MLTREMKNPSDELAQAVERALDHGSLGQIEARVLRTALLRYRRRTTPILPISGDPSPPVGPPNDPASGTEGTTRNTACVDLAPVMALVVAARGLEWAAAGGIQVGADVIVSHHSWIAFRRALRAVTDPEEKRRAQ